ncbi:hypothetical protein EYZ11_012934 [Aspergillus tanneri]|uniref:FAD/NAD(P)-binding domain-containing protein n=1 Tax=Aspergillus tanneri TaxID=1220188 RepID=A0A4S3IYY7_9EURO|nr:hypothetical protein EYZ11_012934 [Aspergillus tanneri]
MPEQTIQVPRFSLPNIDFPDTIDVGAIAETIACNLPTLDPSSLTKNALWHDLFALSGTIRTFQYATTISTTWKHLVGTRGLRCFELRKERVQTKCNAGKAAWIEVPFSFTARNEPIASGLLILSLAPVGEPLDNRASWKIWMMQTILDQLQEEPHGNVDHLDPQNVPSSPDPEKLFNCHMNNPYEVDCVIIGVGQAGLAVAGRLKALGVSYVAIDRNYRVGDNWLRRYDSVKMHTPREFCHLPFERTFTEKYPKWLSKYDLAEGYQGWVDKYGINVWLGTELLAGEWNTTNQKWTLWMRQQGSVRVVSCSHTVLAIGIGYQTPFMPSYSSRELFQGGVLHSVDYRNSWGWKGKNCIIIGSANTAHDIAEDMLNAGVTSVTMIQRGETGLYNAYTPIPLADQMRFAVPPPVRRLLRSEENDSSPSTESGCYDNLEKAGFRRKRHSGLEFFRGRYVDVGASEKIAKGLIKIRSGCCPVAYTETGLAFDDGTQLNADIIVFATGYKFNMMETVLDLFGPEVYKQVDHQWSLRGQDNVNGGYKPTGRKHIIPRNSTLFISLTDLKIQGCGWLEEIQAKLGTTRAFWRYKSKRLFWGHRFLFIKDLLTPSGFRFTLHDTSQNEFVAFVRKLI